MSVLFIAIFSFAIFFIPVVIGKLGAPIFLLSGFISLIIISAILVLLKALTKDSLSQRNAGLKTIILAIYLTFNVLYFTNLIPPIPLSLKELNVYYHVLRTEEGNFRVQSYERPWYEFYKQDEIYLREGDRLYAYSSVFAPTSIESTITHSWSYFNETSNNWTKVSRIPFSISGGRDGGYRGYTYKTAFTPGLWRIDVLTERDQLLGRRKFKVIFSETRPPITTEIK